MCVNNLPRIALDSGEARIRTRDLLIASLAKDGGSVGDNWSHKSCKAPVKSSPPKKPTPSFFTGWMPFLSPNQQCQSTEGKNITFPGLVYPKLTWGLPTLSLTTNSSWLPWGRFALPLISPLMPPPVTYVS